MITHLFHAIHIVQFRKYAHSSKIKVKVLKLETFLLKGFSYQLIYTLTKIKLKWYFVQIVKEYDVHVNEFLMFQNNLNIVDNV